jgi:multidrug efflux pump subunit AcrA (membrane-fusion protein)
LLSEAEHHAQMAAAQAAVARAQAEADTIRAQADVKRVETLRHLQNMFRGYDLALTTHLLPDTPEAVSPLTE